MVNACEVNNGGCGSLPCYYTGPGTSQCVQGTAASTASTVIGVAVGVGVFALVLVILLSIVAIRASRRVSSLPTNRTQQNHTDIEYNSTLHVLHGAASPKRASVSFRAMDERLLY